MTVTAGALPRLPRWVTRFLFKPGNWVPAVVWLFLVLFQAFKAYEEPWVSALGLLLINSVAMVLFVTR